MAPLHSILSWRSSAAAIALPLGYYACTVSDLHNIDNPFPRIFKSLAQRRSLSRDEAREAFVWIMSGRLSDATIAAFLGAMLAKGETVDELVGAALAMREAATPIRSDRPCVDTCGTGGDGISTFNVSTAAALLAAGAGATAAKHGNRTTTRASGSTEALDALGIDTEAPAVNVQRCLNEVGIAYLNARLLHPAMRHAAAARQAVPSRTICNLLGPLTNPAGAKRQVLGVPKPELVDLISQALLELGTDHAWVVHGGDGLCDLTVTTETVVAEVKQGAIRRLIVSPEQAGLRRARLEELLVRHPMESAASIVEILQGRDGPKTDHALLNAAAALVAAGVVGDLHDGVVAARAAIRSGATLAKLEQWRALAPRKGES